MTGLEIALDKPGSPGSLLMRHAERFEISPMEGGHDTKLTDQGRQQAEHLGTLIGPRIGRLITSSVPRCIETAEAMRKGSGLAIPICTDWRPGNPGVWITDTKSAGEAFRSFGPREVVRHQVSGKNLKGLRDLDGGTRLMLDCLLDGIPNNDRSIDVFISHDAVIAPLLGRLIAGADIDYIWPNFLEGALITQSGNQIELLWRGRLHRFSKERIWCAK